MIDLGIVRPGSTIRIPFATFGKTNGESITMTNFAAADILIYKDGSTTERASTSGYTATTDFDSKTGRHLLVIDLADNTTADFFQAGSEYLVAIDSVTVDSQTVGTWAARFQIGYRAAVLNTYLATLASQTSFTLNEGPADDSALVGCIALIHDAASAVQLAIGVVSAYTGSTKTVTLAADPGIFTMAAKDNISFFVPSNMRFLGGSVQSATDLKDFADDGYDPSTNKVQGVVLTDTVTTYTGNTPQTGDSFARLTGTGAVTLASLTVSGTTTLTGAVSLSSTLTISGAVALSSTLAVSGTSSFAAVTMTGTGSSSGLTITGGPTCTVTQGALQLVGGSTSGAAMSLSTTDGHGLVITGTGSARHGVFITSGSSGVSNAIYAAVPGGSGFGIRATTVDVISNLSVGGTTTLTGAVTASNASNSITGITVAAIGSDVITSTSLASSAGTEIAGAVWDLATSGHTTSGTFGAAAVAAGGAGDPWSTSLPGAYGAGTAGYIVGTNVDAAVSSRMATYSQPTGFLAATFPSTVASTTNITTVGAVSGNVSGSVGSLATQAKADVNAEVVDALATDTYAEPGQGAPSATTSLSAKLNYLYKWARNKVTQTSSQTSFYADDGTTVDHKATTSDNGTTFSRGEIASGP